MQVYEHIWSAMLKCAGNGMSKEEALQYVKNNAAYLVLPDTIRYIINPPREQYVNNLSHCRQISHFSDGAWIEFPDTDKLKKGEFNYFVPYDLEKKAADGKTDLISFKKHNQDFYKTKQGQLILYHLVQDNVCFDLFQSFIAKPYYDVSANSESENEQNTFSLYGIDVKDGNAKLNQTGKIVSMQDFRNIVRQVTTLISAELFARLKQSYPDITMEEISESARQSFEANYNSEMVQNSVQFLQPDLKSKVSIINGNLDFIKEQLVSIGAFKNTQEISPVVQQAVDNCVNPPKELSRGFAVMFNPNPSKDNFISDR